MSTYRYFTADLLNGAVLADLPLHAVTYDEELNEPGSANASLNLYASTGLGETVRSATLPARTALFIASDDQLLWGGIIWKRRLRKHVLDIAAAGFLSYFARSRIVSTLAFIGVDQLDIARLLLTHALGKDGGDIGLELGSGGSGRLRDRTYPAADRKPVLEAVQELAAVADGFDLAIRPAFDSGGAVTKVLTLGYPQLGRTRVTTELLVEYPGSASDYEWPEEGDRMITTAYVRGELANNTAPVGATVADPPVEPVAPFAQYTDPGLLAVGYPRLEDEFTATAGTVLQASLDAQAQAAVTAFGHPVLLPTFTVPTGVVGGGPHLAGYQVGDVFRARITDPVWMPATAGGGPGYDGYLRLVKRSVDVGGGDEGDSVTLTMSPTLEG